MDHRKGVVVCLQQRLCDAETVAAGTKLRLNDPTEQHNLDPLGRLGYLVGRFLTQTFPGICQKGRILKVRVLLRLII